jgi:tRNA modification GTPase
MVAAHCNDTIVAVSSPPGQAWRGLLRFSGPAARDVLAALVENPSPDTHAPHRLRMVRLVEPAIAALAHINQGPHSYTGEDAAELQVPGHPALLERLIQRAIAGGARLAEPGEFTFRAFTANKLDLTQAEGVAATIAATSDSQLRAATLLREGRLGTLAGQLVDELSEVLALVEAGIDFSDEEDVVPIGPPALADRLARMRASLGDLLARSRSWGAVEALPRVVLVGPPSSGKTALFNALLGKQRAVVDATAGTTRDVLEEPLTVVDARGRSIELMLVDLAGLDEPGEALSAQMQQAAQAAIERADLLITVQATDHAETWPPPIELPETSPRLAVQTKADLLNTAPASADASPAPHQPAPLPISTVTGQNIDALRAALAGQLSDRATSLSGDMLALQPRHEQAIRTAIERLDAAAKALAPQRDAPAIAEPEVVADLMRGALDALAGLGGRMSPDDVLGKVFSTFCIGK